MSVLLTDWASIRDQRTLAETDDYLVLNKPPGLSVTGERHETDLVRMAKAAGEYLIPVHRIDKVTSGVVLLARTQAAHGPLTRQFTLRTVDKSYLAITRTTGLPPSGTVELPLSTGRKNRVRVGAPREDITFDEASGRWSVPESSVRARSYPSLTRLRRGWEGSRHTLLGLTPTTGRRHQIRVHLAWIGHPIAGDPLFPAGDGAATAGGSAGPATDAAVRTCLHAWRLSFDDGAGRRVTVGTDPDDDFWAPVADGLTPETRADVLGRL